MGAFRTIYEADDTVLMRNMTSFIGCMAFLVFCHVTPLSAQYQSDSDSVIGSVSGQESATVDNYFERGLEEKEKDNYTRALEIWYEAKSGSEDPDFRISRSYIELVTEQGLKEYYEKASELYSWGLSGEIKESEKETFVEELDLLRPMLRDRDYRRFKRAVKNGESEVLSEIEAFWNTVDPSPLRPYNERLLEHFERVAYAKKHYTKRSSDELDDRAMVYLKYGDPYYTRNGTLMYKSSLVNMLVKDGVEVPSFASMDAEVVAHEQRLNLESRVRNLHHYPSYEVWIYRDLTDNPQNTIFMFGTRDPNSSFRKISSVEDFIPNEAYRISGQSNYSIDISGTTGNQNEDNSQSVQFDDLRSSRITSPKVNISPALILQLMYYDQFAAMDEYFGKSYNEMMDRYTDRSNQMKRGLAREFGTMYGSKLVHIQSAAPREKSEHAEEILELPTESYMYRFLDEDDRPYLKIYSVSDFEEAAYYDLLTTTNSLQRDLVNRYVFQSGYQLRDDSDKIVDEQKEETDITSWDRLVNVFDIPHDNPSHSMVISHELHNRSEMNGSGISERTTFPQSLKGMHNSRIDLPEPLNTGELVLSDIILGYGSSDKVEEVAVEDIDAPGFTIAHDRIIPDDADLIFYYELYNLEPKGTEEISEYTFRYSLRKKAKGLFRRSQDDQLSITINNAVMGDRDENILTIDGSELEEGEYTLDIEITDLSSRAEFKKTVDFTVR